MKKIFFYLMLSTFAVLSACKKHDYAAGTLSPITSLEDVRNLYKGSDVAINPESLKGAHQVVGVVISDFSSGNSPEGTLVIQNNRNKRIRGIAIPIGLAAANYLPGDSLKVNLDGGVLKNVNGSLQLTGINETGIEKISSGNIAPVQSVTTLAINANPGIYESTLVTVGGGSFTPAPAVGDTYVGDKTLLNGTNSVILHTETTATFASDLLPLTVNATGVVHLNESGNNVIVQVWPRAISDIKDISDPVIDPVASKYKIIISGFVNNSNGGDGNNEYVQLIATQDIDFSKTPFSLVTCTNAGGVSPNPDAAPGAGWVTGGGRTYKFNLNSGLVKKGEFFYVGGSNKRINGANSTDISSSKWIRSIAYGTNAGDGGVGNKSSGIFPNSGKPGGIAIFAGTNINADTQPLDVVFFGNNDKTTIFNNTGVGYRVADNDHYNAIDPATSNPQPFFYEGTNSYVIPHNAYELGFFVKLGGSFNSTTKTWATPRGYVFFPMTMETKITEIETGSDVIVLSN